MPPSAGSRFSQDRDCLRLLFGIVGVCCVILVVRESWSSSLSSPAPLIPKSSAMLQAAALTTREEDDADLIQYVPIEHDRKVDQLQMIRYAAYRNDGPVSVLDWAQALAESPNRIRLAQDFNHLIQQLPYGAVYMETKGASATTAPTKPWEVAFLSAPRLQAFAEAKADPHAFGEHFAKCSSSTSTATATTTTTTTAMTRTVCSFSNLGGDAYLIAPMPPPLDTNTTTTTLIRHYSHLAAFARHAPDRQVTEFWTTVAREYYQRLHQSSTTGQEANVWWLNTEGTGVAWLHVRLDRRPKYYHYMPFAHET